MSTVLLLLLVVNSVVHSAWIASAGTTRAAMTAGPTAPASKAPRQVSTSADASSSTSSSSTESPASTAAVRDLVVLGDSVPAGNACDCTPYGGLVAADLTASEGTAVTAHTLAFSGAAVGDVVEQVGENDDTRAALRATDVVVVTVGANDLDQSALLTPACSSPAAPSCYGDALGTVRDGLLRVVAAVRAAAGDRSPRILLTGYWNVFLDGAVARDRGDRYVARSKVATRAFNAVVADVARASGASYVDVFAAFSGDGSRDLTPLLAPDGDHPSAAGHRAIADAVEKVLAAA